MCVCLFVFVLFVFVEIIITKIEISDCYRKRIWVRLYSSSRSR